MVNVLTYSFLYYITYVQKTVLKKREVFLMLAVNYTTLRDNMKAYMDKVTDDYETMIVTSYQKNLINNLI